MITFGSDVGDLILQRTLSDNTLGLSHAIERMTSGYKVNHAKDNAAGYSIITDLNTKISSMLQVQSNTENGLAMLQTAEGGLEEIQGLLERLRALAEQASNDSYGADAREAMQSEADEIIEEIERIRNSIEYNGMSLYETPREDAVTTAVNRLSASAKVSNAGEIYPKKHNDTQKSSAAFTPATDGGVNSLSSSSAVSLLSNNTIEGAVDFAAKESKTIDIDGVQYTITNRNSVDNALSYMKDTDTGQITFLGSYLTIAAQKNVSHNIIIQGGNNSVYGGNFDDRIEIAGSSSKQNLIYAGAGDDTIIDSVSWSNTLYGGEGNDTFYLSGAGAKVYGEDGNDTFYVSDQRMNIYGGKGDDIFNLQGGYSIKYNRLYGEDGEDTFNIQGSNNTVYGGEGTNAINDNGTGTVSVDVPGANSYIVELGSYETKELEINGIKYTVTNQKNAASSLVYSMNDDGSIKFQGSFLTITGEANKAHNVVLEMSNSVFNGGNLADNIILAGATDMSGTNTIYGGAGNDIIKANTATNLIYGGSGDDTIEVINRVNRVYGEAGNDDIRVIKNSTDLTTYIDGGADDDRVTIDSGINNVTVAGGSGSDTLINNGTDTIFTSGFDSGTDDAEEIVFGAKETRIITINGINYTITNNLASENTLLYSYNPVSGEISFGGYNWNIIGEENQTHNVIVYSTVSNFYGGKLNDNIVIYGSNNTIYGGAGDDEIISSANSNKVYGEDGNDTITAYGGYIFGGAGDDIININNSSMGVSANGGLGNDTYNVNKAITISDDGGNNIYNINTDNANVSGSSGNDTFYVSGNNNTVLGGGGDDYFVIDGSNNMIDGGTGTNYYIDNGSGTSMSNVNRDPNAGGLSFTYQGETQTFTLNGKTYTVTNNLSGSNTLQYSLNPNTGVITLNGSSLEISADTNETAILNIRGDNNVINGSNLDDRIIIEQGSNNTINGLNGNDNLTSNSINNSLLGGIGNDTINLNASTNLTVDGGAGDDILNISSDNNTNVIAGAGKNTLNITGSNNTLTASDGDNRIVASGSSNSISLGEGNNNITITGSSNTLTAGSGNNTLGVQGNLNNITLDNAVDEVNIYGDENTVTTNNGENSIVIRGDGNNYTTQNGNKEIEVRGDDNIIQGGSGIDDIRINGNNNTAKGGDSSDTFMVSQGNNNTIDGEGGDRNTLINNGNNTTFTNAVDITPRPFEVNIKVDIGSGDDKFISTEISFNLFDFSVDFSSSRSARESLEAIDDMLKTVNEQILNIGTTINRLETVLDAQSSKLENMISTRSTLRDADIAEESSSFIKYQILQQASATLIAASRNMRYENVLGLLGNISR